VTELAVAALARLLELSRRAITAICLVQIKTDQPRSIQVLLRPTEKTREAAGDPREKFHRQRMEERTLVDNVFWPYAAALKVVAKKAAENRRQSVTIWLQETPISSSKPIRAEFPNIPLPLVQSPLILVGQHRE
jgi:hypothetical protein